MATKTDPRMVDLAMEIRALHQSTEQQRRRKLWDDVMSLRSTDPIINFFMYRHAWKEMAQEQLVHREGVAGFVELQLRFKLFQAKHMPDDTPIDPTVFVFPVFPESRPPMWGIEARYVTNEATHGRRELPVIESEADVAKLREPVFEIDEARTRQAVDQARKLIGDAMPVWVWTDEMGSSPVEHVVSLRGIENLMTDVYDQPQMVHAMMRKVTDGMVSYHRQCQQRGAYRARGVQGHVPHHAVPAGLESDLKGGWQYVGAQSAMGLSPAMYEEFIHPYNCRVAETAGWVYYHGCEDLSQKCGIIQSLPNLRLFHISPWTPPEPVIAKLGNRFAHEVHSHPSHVLFDDDPTQVRDELRRRCAAARGTSHVLTLADVETFGGNFERTVRWARMAREAAYG